MLTVLDKELMDAVRDRRALLSSLFYCLMGPGVVWLISRAVARQTAVLVGMISVFALVAAFSGSMNVAMDAIAGEKRRDFREMGGSDDLRAGWTAAVPFRISLRACADLPRFRAGAIDRADSPRGTDGSG